MGAPAATRLPSAPLIEFARRRLMGHPNLALVTDPDGRPTLAMVATELGVSTGRVLGIAYRDFIRHSSADELACRLGVHPTAIWGDDYYRHTEIDGHPYVDPDDLKGTT